MRKSRPRIQLHHMTLIAVALSAIVTLACFVRYSLAAGNVYEDKFISAGAYHTCGVKTDGTLACWGRSRTYGQATPPAGTFTQVTTGWWHTCGVKSDGTVACWGRNLEGQLNAVNYRL